MFVNNNQSIQTLVKEFNKFQIQKDKAKGPVGQFRKLQKEVRKLVYLSKYKYLKRELTRRLLDLNLIPADKVSILNRKKAAKTKVILNAINQFQNGLGAYSGTGTGTGIGTMTSS